VRKQHPKATLLVMSDHGFAAFERAVNLNTWLLGHGYLRLKSALSDDAHDLASNVDWSGTQAYAMGLNSIYLNLAGREAHGVVSRAEASELAVRIANELREWRDPDHMDAAVVTSTWAPQSGDRLAPDLVVGFARGYRASWDGAMGAIGPAPIEDNRDEWIGDHCMDAAAVPGVLLGNRKSKVEKPRLMDLPVSILGLYHIDAPAPMKGVTIY
jgi:predicted AlkP superfamily phosphohydrolase/phosphomutase